MLLEVRVVFQRRSAGRRLQASCLLVPPVWAVDKLHAAGIPCMNMVGHVKHCAKALAVGQDFVLSIATPLTNPILHSKGLTLFVLKEVKEEGLF